MSAPWCSRKGKAHAFPFCHADRHPGARLFRAGECPDEGPACAVGEEPARRYPSGAPAIAACNASGRDGESVLRQVAPRWGRAVGISLRSRVICRGPLWIVLWQRVRRRELQSRSPNLDIFAGRSRRQKDVQGEHQTGENAARPNEKPEHAHAETKPLVSRISRRQVERSSDRHGQISRASTSDGGQDRIGPIPAGIGH